MTELWSEYAIRVPRGISVRSFELGICHDNVAITAGTGTSIATDTISTVEYQRVKQSLGPDGTANDAVALADLTTAASSHAGIAATAAADRRFTSQNLSGTAVSSTTTWDCQAAGMATVYITTGTTGTIRFEVSTDGTNFANAEAYDTATDLWISGTAVTPTTGKVYKIITRGFRTLRIIVVTTVGSASIGAVCNMTQGDSLVRAIDTGPAPHAYGFALTGKTAQYTTTQTGVALWTPASGKKLVITAVQIQAGGTTVGTMQLWFGASADTTYSRGTDLAIFDGEFAPSSTLKPGVVMNGPWMASAADHILRVTDSAAINPLTVTAWGYEIV